MSCHDKQVILETHNRLRQMLALGQIRGQPPSLDMRELVGSPLSFIYLFILYIWNESKLSGKICVAKIICGLLFSCAFVGIRSGMKNWRLLLKGGQINATLDTTVSEEQV
jgi:hypothetical protein